MSVCKKNTRTLPSDVYGFCHYSLPIT